MSDEYKKFKFKTWKKFIDRWRDGKLKRFSVWRGQAERHRNLLPPIYREPYKETLGENEFKTLRLFYEQSRGIADDVQHLQPIQFPENDDKYDKHEFFTRPEVFEWWSLARHHELPTPFLDWSLYALTALFMGLYGIEEQDKAGDSYPVSVWSLDFPEAKNDLETLVHPIYEGYDNGGIFDKSPRDGVGLYLLTGNGLNNKRLVAQGGLFTFIFPDEERKKLPKNQRYDVIEFVKAECTGSTLNEYVINFDSKKDIDACRMFLMRAGITPRTMFPDLKGVVDDCMYRLQTGNYTACPLPMTSRDVSLIIKNRSKKK